MTLTIFFCTCTLKKKKKDLLLWTIEVKFFGGHLNYTKTIDQLSYTEVI